MTRGGSLEFGQGYLWLPLPDLHPIHDIVGGSGTCVLLLVKQEPSYLGLVHFSATASHTTFRKLDVGDFSVSSCDRVALDDSLGLVLAVDDVGILTAISYVYSRGLTKYVSAIALETSRYTVHEFRARSRDSPRFLGHPRSQILSFCRLLKLSVPLSTGLHFLAQQTLARSSRSGDSG